MASEPKEDGSMSRKRHKPEEIVAKLRQVDVLVAQGTPVADAIRTIGGTEVTYQRRAGTPTRLVNSQTWAGLPGSSGSGLLLSRPHHNPLSPTNRVHGAPSRMKGPHGCL